ncbi:hypothetical protein Mp_7g07530 [Marchantia polymorpha subsp. ruderalis]|uniref:Uncharacterized protein n=2 Tax=Marchantia polymorpha TaxID=3197 RepID=A0AAF6BX47_MARPO|nr:hypothetical protein MARPO_0076s0041 [Marchantia polymorpha]BBN16581.1 hypothetical protein Mp_7g07530 [Marchantia polymorpha subsp. ruderalis]|eukprot:PTQ34797.1 hypothetical protein MARPO_0076s0041 [Marchantia polymorpha]
MSCPKKKQQAARCRNSDNISHLCSTGGGDLEILPGDQTLRRTSKMASRSVSVSYERPLVASRASSTFGCGGVTESRRTSPYYCSLGDEAVARHLEPDVTSGASSGHRRSDE